MRTAFDSSRILVERKNLPLETNRFRYYVRLVKNSQRSYEEHAKRRA
jgi:hypothetical protein